MDWKHGELFSFHSATGFPEVNPRNHGMESALDLPGDPRNAPYQYLMYAPKYSHVA